MTNLGEIEDNSGVCDNEYIRLGAVVSEVIFAKASKREMRASCLMQGKKIYSLLDGGLFKITKFMISPLFFSLLHLSNNFELILSEYNFNLYFCF